MDAKEVRIGNWCHSSLLEPFQCNASDIVACEKNIGDGAIKYIPIPLTEEWSKKFGAIIKGTFHEFPTKNIHLIINWTLGVIELTVDNGDDEWDSILIKIPKYVHLFQNLYFALTGEELTIKE